MRYLERPLWIARISNSLIKGARKVMKDHNRDRVIVEWRKFRLSAPSWLIWRVVLLASGLLVFTGVFYLNGGLFP